MKTNEDIYKFEVQLSHPTPEIGSYWEIKWTHKIVDFYAMFLILDPAPNDKFYCLNHNGKVEIRTLGFGYGPCK